MVYLTNKFTKHLSRQICRIGVTAFEMKPIRVIIEWTIFWIFNVDISEQAFYMVFDSYSAVISYILSFTLKIIIIYIKNI